MLFSSSCGSRSALALGTYPPLHPLMSSTLFTTDGGDVILRAGQEPGSKHDFCVHKFILSLASSVFKDMFTFPQPHNQNHNDQSELPVVNVPDPPEVLDVILRFIYPGVEPPKFTDVRLVSTLLSAADKYHIASMSPSLRESLKSFVQAEPFRVYIIACQFGFLDEAMTAAKISTSSSYVGWEYEEEIRHISSTDLFRFVHFVRSREDAGRKRIQEHVEWWPTSLYRPCDSSPYRDFGGYGGYGFPDDQDDNNGEHQDDSSVEHQADAKGFYLRLAKAVEDAFVRHPYVEFKGLLTVLHCIQDPPPCCQRSMDPANFESSVIDDYKCPLQPILIRNSLRQVARKLDDLNRTMLKRFFEKGVGSG
jgi:hypothetical protein